MNKSAIQRFAIWARTELIDRVSQRAYQYDITKDGYGDANAETASGRPLTPDEQRQRRELVEQIRQKGYAQVMEEVAYTWFNRFIALRFMEVNNYLPSHTRVFSDSTGAFKPEILEEAMHLDLPGLEKDKVLTLLERNQTEDLYRYLLLTQCNALNEALPGMFERMGGYTEMLLPNNILRQDSVLGRMVTDIPEEDWRDAVQIIGWLYQYYNTELKDDTFAKLKKNVKITKERIPAATQLFTPDWIVRYMVENSLGRLWLEGHPNAELHDGWKYYLDEAEQERSVEAQLAKLREEYKIIKPEEIKVIDPCMGSGHILVYAFDVLMQIYISAGWDQREAAQSILRNNLYGLDIDDRAAQLAYFAVMMKARQYDRRLFSRGIQPNLYAIRESNGIPAMAIEYFHNNDPELKADITRIVKEMWDAKEYGSILNITPVDFDRLYDRFDEIYDDISILRTTVWNELLPVVRCAEVLAQKYEVVATNPPYIGRRNLNRALCNYLDTFYPASKMDLFSAFIERNLSYCRKNYFSAYMTPFVWLFLGSYTSLRKNILTSSSVCSFVQPQETSFQDAAVSICSFVLKKVHMNYRSAYIKQSEFNDPRIQAQLLQNAASSLDCEYRFDVNMKIFYNFPDYRFIYWAGNGLQASFSHGTNLGDVCQPRQGMATTNNDLFLRLWHEVNLKRAGFKCKDEDDSLKSGMKWFPYNKGGGYRKWYGNFEYFVNYENKGKTICDYTPGAHVGSNGRVINRQFFFHKSITWSDICGTSFAARACPTGFVFDVKGSSAFISERLYNHVLAFLNSNVCTSLLNTLNPTVTTQVGDLKQLPFINTNDDKIKQITLLAQNCIQISKDDWDSYETSWDFKRNPLV